MDDFKKEMANDLTTWDLNCRHVVPHDRRRNKLEQMFRRKARRKNREKLKKVLDK